MKTRIPKFMLTALLSLAFLLPLTGCGNARSYWGIENEYGYAGGVYGPEYVHYKHNPDRKYWKHHKHHKHHKKHHKHYKRKHNPDRRDYRKHNPDYRRPPHHDD